MRNVISLLVMFTFVLTISAAGESLELKGNKIIIRDPGSNYYEIFIIGKSKSYYISNPENTYPDALSNLIRVCVKRKSISAQEESLIIKHFEAKDEKATKSNKGNSKLSHMSLTELTAFEKKMDSNMGITGNQGGEISQHDTISNSPSPNKSNSFVEWLNNIKSSCQKKNASTSTGKKSFSLISGEIIIGSVKAFSNSEYEIETNHGLLKIKESDIKTISAESNEQNLNQWQELVSYHTKMNKLFQNIFSQVNSGINVIIASQLFATTKSEMDALARPEFKELTDKYNFYFLLLRYPFQIKAPKDDSLDGNATSILYSEFQKYSPLADELRMTWDKFSDFYRDKKFGSVAYYEKFIAEYSLNEVMQINYFIAATEIASLNSLIHN